MLINTIDTLVSPHTTIQTTPHFQFIWHCQEYGFRNRGVPCNYGMREEETKCKIFGLMCRGWLFVAVYW